MSPFLPFTRPQIDEATIAGVGEVMRSGWITSGPQVRAFEAELSRLCAGRAVRSFSSGTAALEVALRLAGLPVDRDRLYSISTRKKLRVIEDAAQSFGASWRGKPVGSFGDLVAFSFHASKNITSAEGGALVLPDEKDVALCEKLRLQGVVRSGEDGMEVDVLGGKWNLTDIAARIGLGQLPHLQAFTERRRALAKRYFERWDADGELPPRDFENSNWHMFQVVLPERAEPAGEPSLRARFIRAMREQGIGVGVHYPAMHLFALYRRLGWRAGQFPHAERVGRSIVTLPLFPAMSDDDVKRVCVAAGKALA